MNRVESRAQQNRPPDFPEPTEDQILNLENELPYKLDSSTAIDSSFLPTEPLDLVSREIYKGPLLTLKQEQSLGRKIQAGLSATQSLNTFDQVSQNQTPEQKELEELKKIGELARDELVEKNLRLVLHFAGKYKNRGIPVADLFQEGSIGLIRAAEKYDPDRGWRFSTYATWWIKQGITRALGDDSRTIRIPVHAGALANRVNRTSIGLEQMFGKKPTTEDIATEMNLPINTVVESLNNTNHLPISLEKSVVNPEGDTDSTLNTFLQDPNANVEDDVTKSLLQKEVQALLANLLTPREQMVINLRMGTGNNTPMTLTQVGEHLGGVSRERVRQIEADGMRKLKKARETKQFKFDS